MTARVLTVILNYRTAEMTLRSVEAARTAMRDIDGEIIVVDNDSQDGSFAKMSAHAQAQGWTKDNAVRVVEAGQNGGFGAGNNFGIRAGLSDGSAPDYVYVLNSDAFPAPDAISALLTYLQDHPKVGFAGSYTHGEDGAPHLTTFRFPTVASEFEGAIRFGPVSRLLANKRVPIEIPESTQSVEWLAGASMLLRCKTLDEIGLFDERFFLYFEETDLCLRAQRAGWGITYVRESQVTHIGSVSTGMSKWQRTPDYWYNSRLYYFTKNHGPVVAALATFAHMVGGMLHRVRQGVQGRKPVDPPHFLRMLLCHDFKAMFKRRRAPKVPQLNASSLPVSE